MKISAVVGAGLLLAMSGCVTLEQREEPPMPINPSPERLAIFVADNQYVEDYGAYIGEQGEAAARLLKTARRSALNNLFALDVIALIHTVEVENDSRPFPIIHLGDGLNNSCTTELEKFIEGMARTESPWFMAPGNHDSYYLGISYPSTYRGGRDGKLLSSRRGWGDLCTPWRDRDRNGIRLSKMEIEKAILDKRDFIKSYLVSLADRGFLRVGTSGFEGNQCQENPSGYLRKICWRLSAEGASQRDDPLWDDFVVQEISLKDGSGEEVRIILADTVTLESRPPKSLRLTAERDPPLAGELGSAQKGLIRQWFVENKEQGVKSILAGHHPYRGLVTADKKTLEKWAEERLFSLYVSAHTHAGETNDYAGFREVNIGSLVDAPVEYGILVAHTVGGRDGVSIHNVFLTEPSPTRLRSLSPEAVVSLEAVCDKQIILRSAQGEQSLGDVASVLHKDSRKGKARSLRKEAETYRYLIETGVIDIDNSFVPVCYRKFHYKCDMQEGVQENGQCATASDVESCPSTNSRFLNLKVLVSKQSVLSALDLLITNLGMKEGRELYQIEGSRLLDAVARYVKINENRTDDRERVKGCLSIIGSELKERID